MDLVKLDLCHNKLQGYREDDAVSFQEGFLGEFRKLKRLYLNDNQLKEFPEDIGHCSDLIELYLGGNQVSFLPDGIADCKKLRRFLCGRNKVKVVPAKLGSLDHLEELSGTFVLNETLQRAPWRPEHTKSLP